jgi:acetyl-CoA synthetase
MSSTTNIESLQNEERVFHPPTAFAETAHIKSMEELEALRAEASADPEAFLARFAESELHWFKKWDDVLVGPPHIAVVLSVARSMC